jgi:hypothetical protein
MVSIFIIMLSNELISTLDKLPESLQLEVLHYAEFLAEKYVTDIRATHPVKRRQAGTMKGMFVMSEDFDAPLEELKDYM